MSNDSLSDLQPGMLFDELSGFQVTTPAPTLPTLEELLAVVEKQPASIRFARRNHPSKCPLAKLYQWLYGGSWLVDTEVILWFKGKDEVWGWTSPEDVVAAILLLDDPAWKPGRPHKAITYGELGARLAQGPEQRDLHRQGGSGMIRERQLQTYHTAGAPGLLPSAGSTRRLRRPAIERSANKRGTIWQ